MALLSTLFGAGCRLHFWRQGTTGKKVEFGFIEGSSLISILLEPLNPGADIFIYPYHTERELDK